MPAMVGAAFAAASWELAKIGFTFYALRAGSYSLVYGSLATLPLFMIWVFLTWLLVLLGAELSFVIQNHRALLARRNYKRMGSVPEYMLALALRDLKLGRARIGFGKSRGLGHVALNWGMLTIRYMRKPKETKKLEDVALLLGKKEAEQYGYLVSDDRTFGYTCVQEDASDGLGDLTLDKNDWGEWELVVPGEQVEDVWKKCIAAWKAAIRMEGGQ